MKLKDLVGKRAVRTKPRMWINEEYSAFTGLIQIHKEDRSFTTSPIYIKKVTDGVFYYYYIIDGSAKVCCGPLCEYDDENWEEYNPEEK